MGRIHVLPENVANKIAAGEVVERPASVVKELLENSLDASATEIRIDAENAGRRLIRIQDNGCGMLRDDALLAFERHATSKLSEVKDLLANATPVMTSSDRAFQVFGPDVMQDLIEMRQRTFELQLPPPYVPPNTRAPMQPPEAETVQFALEGLISGPHVQKLNRNSVFLFVN